MFGPRTPRYPMLQAYLASRPSTPLLPGIDRASLAVGAATCAGLSGVSVALHQAGILSAVAAAGAIMLGFRAWRARPPAPPTPEQELARRADRVVKELTEHGTRLHRALHPAIGATLEECATYLARIAVALEGPGWEDASTQWSSLRGEALAASKVAMDEALVHAGASLAFVPPARPLEHVSDALEDIGLGSLIRDERLAEPPPPSFRPIRELAERLRELAVRCESAAVGRRAESAEPLSPAFRRLDATLGEMRQIEEAEGELRHGA